MWCKLTSTTGALRMIRHWWVLAFDAGSGLAPVKDVKQASREEEDKGRAIHCVRCDAIVTYSGHSYFYNGGHHHRCVNPHGLVFDLGLYQQAVCRVQGEPTEQWSWFSGYAWQVALCAACGEHLGWAFSGRDGSGFYGLILARLRQDE